MSLNDTEKPKLNSQDGYFWQSERSLEYKGVSGNLPLSNIPATEVVYSILQPKDKRIIDYGCFQGDSTKRVLDHGAAQVVGVDINPTVIEIAQNKFSEESRLSFHLLDGSTDILSLTGGSLFDAASVTFVHPTIPSIEIMDEMMHRLFSVLKPGSLAVFLGLHPDSFQGYIFNNYAHRLPSSGVYKDGEKFPNQLIMNDGNVLRFDDYCWTSETIKKSASLAGFSNTESIDVIRGQMGEHDNALDASINLIKETKGIDFTHSPEFTVPLYQIFVATK